jgi:Bacterial membrane protein YfhO
MLQVLRPSWLGLQMPGWHQAGLGLPLIADPSMAVFYPGHLLVWVVSPLTALNLFMVGHLALGYAGAYALARRRCALTPSAALISALGYGLSGAALSHVHAPMFVAGTAWVPWSVLGLLFALERRSVWRLPAAAAPFALCYLAASPELCLMAALLALVCARLWTSASWARLLLVLLATGSLALGLAALSVVPYLCAASELNRAAGFSLEESSLWSLHPLNLLGLVVPRAVGEGGLPLAWTGDASRPWYPTLYLGAVPAACLAVGLGTARSDRRARALTLVALALCAYAAGRVSPVYRAAFELLPPVRSFRYPAKWFVPALLCLSLLAGLGWDRVRERPRDVRGGLLVVLGLAASVLALACARGVWTLAARALLPVGVSGLALLAVRLERKRALRALLALAVLDVGAGAMLFLSFGPRALYEERPALVDAVLAEEAARGEPQRVVSTRSAWESWRRLRSVDVTSAVATQLAWRQALFPNAGTPYGVRHVHAMTAVGPARHQRFRQAADEQERARGPDLCARLARQGCALAVYAAGDEELDGVAQPVTQHGPWILGRLPDAPPWAAVYPNPVRAGSPQQALRHVLDPEFVPGRSCVVEGPAESVAATAGDTAGPVGWVTSRVQTADRLELETWSPAPGVLVVRDGWAPGWTARVDGEPVDLWPADYLFRGVPVPAGSHVVELRYTTPGWELGRALSLASLVLCLLLVVVPRAQALTRTSSAP